MVEGEGLLAEDRLAGGEELHGGRVVRRVGGGVDGGVELAPGDGVGEAAEGVGDGVGGGEVAGALGVHVGGGDELAAGDEGELLGVGAGDGAGAEDEQALGAGGVRGLGHR